MNGLLGAGSISLIGAARLGAMTGLLGLTTCGTSLDVRRSLTPPPSRACVEAAFMGSPRVSELAVLPTEGGSASYGLRMWDPEARDSIWRAGVDLEPTADSGALVTIEFVWSPGKFSPRSRAEAQRVERLAAALLTEVTGACAPETTAPITCIYASDNPFAPRRSGPCAV